ncbi:MAPEG family protein (plasmid) [Sinorhizobium meliloti]
MPNSRKPEVDLRAEQKRIYQGSAAAFLVCSVVLCAAYVYLPRLVQFPHDDLQSNLTFWAGSNVFIVIWIMIGVGMVSRGRRHSIEDIRGSAYSAPSPRIAVPVAFLQNTLEQAVIAMFLQLALALLLGSDAMPVIGASVLLFGVGRITFFFGYPNGAGARSFGMALTALPSLAAFVLVTGALVSRMWQ